jgi:hypothetical protein
MTDLTITFTTLTCGHAECGITFAVPTPFFNKLRETGRSFYCPNGHCRLYTDTDIDRLKRELEQARSSASSWQESAERRGSDRDRAERRVRALRGVVTKLRRRLRADSALKRSIAEEK